MQFIVFIFNLILILELLLSLLTGNLLCLSFVEIRLFFIFIVIFLLFIYLLSISPLRVYILSTTNIIITSLHSLHLLSQRCRWHLTLFYCCLFLYTFTRITLHILCHFTTFTNIINLSISNIITLFFYLIYLLITIAITFTLHNFITPNLNHIQVHILILLISPHFLLFLLPYRSFHISRSLYCYWLFIRLNTGFTYICILPHFFLRSEYYVHIQSLYLLFIIFQFFILIATVWDGIFCLIYILISIYIFIDFFLYLLKSFQLLYLNAIDLKTFLFLQLYLFFFLI